VPAEIERTHVRPVTLDIHGDWWDCHLYAGQLYLVTIDGDIFEVDWPRLIESLIVRELDRLAFDLSFIDARYLYGGEWERLVRDPEVGALLTDKINRLADMDLQVDLKTLSSFGRWHHGVLPEALSDIEIYRGTMYVGSSDGLETVDRRHPERGRLKHWDGRPSEIRANRGSMLAIAAGADGLRQVLVPPHAERMNEPSEVLLGDFTGCNWLHTSIYGSSHANAGALAVFSHTAYRKPGRITRVLRTFEAKVDEEDIFDRKARANLDESLREDASRRVAIDSTKRVETAIANDEVVTTHFDSRYERPPAVTDPGTGFSWAGADLICRAAADAISIVQFRPSGQRYSHRLRPVRTLALDNNEAVAGGNVAPFGVLMETEDDLLVLSESGVVRLGISPVRWRTYPRATNYPNHLHVVGEDRIRILSFLNEDMRQHAQSRPGASFTGRARRA
jgi:hypothetical protein